MISGPRWIKLDEIRLFQNSPRVETLLLRMVAGWNPFLFSKAPVLDSPLSQFNRAFNKTDQPPCITLRAALHLEAGPFCCVRGFKSSLAIGQKAHIGPNLFTPRGRADLVVWFFFLNVCYDTAKACWIGCTQNGRPILDLEANVRFH
jgi:hypothetical protein